MTRERCTAYVVSPWRMLGQVKCYWIHPVVEPWRPLIGFYENHGRHPPRLHQTRVGICMIFAESRQTQLLLSRRFASQAQYTSVLKINQFAERETSTETSVNGSYMEPSTPVSTFSWKLLVPRCPRRECAPFIISFAASEQRSWLATHGCAWIYLRAGHMRRVGLPFTSVLAMDMSRQCIW